MTIDPQVAAEASGTLLTLVMGVYAAIKHMRKRNRIAKAKYRQDILDQAEAQVTKVKTELESKIEKLEIELEAQKLNIFKDLSHIKENYSMEIRVLGEKIEDVRAQIQQQHAQLVALLTRMIENK